jgi:hypothetical protein
MSLTGVRDVDMEIIMNLTDRELPAVCSVNKYVNDICQSDAFWYKRLIKRIIEAREDNYSKYKKLIMIDVTGERIREMQRFLGLKSLKELNSYLNELPPKAAYLAYHDFPRLDRRIKFAYDLHENELPKYINHDELRYELRRQVLKAWYFPKIDDRLLPYPDILFIKSSQQLDLPQVNYDAYKIMGII